MHRSHSFYCLPIVSACLFLIPGSSGAQDATPVNPGAYPAYLNNYVRTWEATAPVTDMYTLMGRPVRDVKETTVYLDGLGRTLQSVMKQGSLSTGSAPVDLVSPLVYDELGREIRQYLPFAANSTAGNASVSDGLFKLNAFDQQKTFYDNQLSGQGESFYYGKTEYEPSPLNRIDRTYAPGNSWVHDGRGKGMKYYFNTAVDDVKIWEVTDVAGGFGSYAVTGVYDAGELYKNVTTDEKGVQLEEFKDKEGRVILKKLQLTAVLDDGTGSGYTDWLCVYYLYDALNNLRCTIQPEAVKQMALTGNWSLDPVMLSEQCFRYEYNQRGRIVMKKVPGAGEAYIVYDARDRVVMTQDANMRTNNQWMVILYENSLNRPVQTGLLSGTWNNKTFAQNLADASASTAYPFDVTSVPSSNYWDCHTKTGYDDYSAVPSASGLTSAPDNTYTSSTYINTAYNSAPDYPQQPVQSLQTRGMETWSQVKVLGTSNYLYTVTIYDEKGRSIQSKSKNTGNGTDVITSQYNWAGQPLVIVQKQEKAGTSAQTNVLITQLNYDDLGRLVRTAKKISNSLVNNGTLPANWTTLSEKGYDALGQVMNKKLGKQKDNFGNYTSTPVETLAYSYNIRGWLLGINKDYLSSAGRTSSFFGTELDYDKDGYAPNGSKQYNGSIGAMIWRSQGDGEKRKYEYVYDNANRLLKADFSQEASGSWSNGVVNFDVKMGDGADPAKAYDANGNILRMQQWGLKPGASSQVDDLTYTYVPGSNRLQNVRDAFNDATSKLGDFKTSGLHPQNGAKQSATTPAALALITDYDYDPNGNLKKDYNKDLGDLATDGIQYNYLNMPSLVIVKNKGTIGYIYDASGNKLQKIVTENAGVSNGNIQTTTTTTYIDGFVYESRIKLPADPDNPDYTDRLQFAGHEEGRVRAVYDPTGATMTGFAYDYMIRDHQGNIRMLLTDEQQQDVYPAVTLEGSLTTSTDAAYTENKFYNIDPANVADNSEATGITVYPNNNGNPPYNNNSSSNSTANSQKLYRMLATSSGGVTGLGITLKVMSGDRLDIFGKSYYFNNNTGGSNYQVPVTSIVSGMFGAPGGAAGSKGIVAADVTGQSALTNLINGFLNDPDRANNGVSTTPRAYINWILFDENFKKVDGSFDRVGGANSVKNHSLTNIPVTQNGYLYVYVSNESPVKVFFDNLQVIHTRGPVLEETHYYPFGLTMAGISSKAFKKNYGENKYRYNDKELQNKEFSDGSGLELYDYGARMQDPQIGRFHMPDPHAYSYASVTPYAYVVNNPSNATDPTGMDVHLEGEAAQAFFKEIQNADYHITLLEYMAQKIADEQKKEDKPGAKYLSADGAAVGWSRIYPQVSFQDNFSEYASLIYSLEDEDGHTYYYFTPGRTLQGAEKTHSPGPTNKIFKQDLPKGAKVVAHIHSHTIDLLSGANEDFSTNPTINEPNPDEVMIAVVPNLDYYLTTPRGSLVFLEGSGHPASMVQGRDNSVVIATGLAKASEKASGHYSQLISPILKRMISNPKDSKELNPQ